VGNFMSLPLLENMQRAQGFYAIYRAFANQVPFAAIRPKLQLHLQWLGGSRWLAAIAR